MPDWQGGTLKETFRADYVSRNVRCFEPFKAADWDRAFDPETFDTDLVNCFELRDSPDVEPKAWTLMHYAAAAGAPAWVAARLTEAGATRCAKDWMGRTPLDVAREAGRASEELMAELTPRYAMQGLHEAQLDAIEANFHALIRQVTCGLAESGHLALPPVRTLLESHVCPQGGEYMNFPVPGMYGGFYGIRLEMQGSGGASAVSHLLCESWCRVAGGSGRRDKVTAEGTELLESGFV